MKIAVRYFTKTGNTKKLADAIAEVAGVEAMPVSVPLDEPVDLLFLGSSVYATGVAGEVKAFISGLDGKKVGKVAAFSTAALLPSTYKQVANLLGNQCVPVCMDEFHCRGQFAMLHKGKPDEADLEKAREFARKVIG